MTSDLPTALISTPRTAWATHLLRGLASSLTLGTALIWGTLWITTPVTAQTTLDVNLEGQQAAPPVPPLPDMAGVIYVDAANGSDSSGDGTQANPYRTITYATEQAAPRTVIQLLPGIYSEESGETFPITLRAGQVLRGDESTLGEDYLIVGGGTYISPTLARQNITMLAETGTGIRGVTMRNEGRRGYALWLESTAPRVFNNSFVGSIHDGIFLTGSAGGVIAGNRFYQNGANGISVLGTSAPTVRNNLFQETGFGVTIDKQSTPRLENNRIIGNRSGVIVGGSARPILRGNLVKDNLDAGLVAITQGQPDLGTASDPGNNQFEGNGNLAINNSTKGGIVVSANGNQISGEVKGQIDTSGQVSAAQVDTAAMPAVVAPGSIQDPMAMTSSGGTASVTPADPGTASDPTPAPTQATAPTPQPQLTPLVSPQAQATPIPAPRLTPIPTPTPTPLPQLTPIPVTPAPTPASPSTGSSTGESLEFTAVPFQPETETPGSTTGSTGTETGSPDPIAVAPTPAPTEAPLLDITTLRPVGSPSSPPPDLTSSSAPTDPAPTSPAVATAQTPAPAPDVAPSTDAAQFRVLVTPNGEGDLTQLQQIVPEAVETSFNGRNVFQAGLYDSRSAAQAVLDQLLDAGFDAVAEMIFIQ